MPLILLKSSTCQLGATSLVDDSGAAITDATVTATIYNTLGVAVAGQAWPVTLAHDVGGNYYATLDAGINVDVGKRYFAEVLAVSGASQKTWRCPVSVVYAC